jgi:hypothetical protein
MPWQQGRVKPYRPETRLASGRRPHKVMAVGAHYQVNPGRHSVCVQSAGRNNRNAEGFGRVVNGVIFAGVNRATNARDCVPVTSQPSQHRCAECLLPTQKQVHFF